MACAAFVKGKATLGSRDWGRRSKESPMAIQPNSYVGKACGQKSVSNIINEANNAYHEGTSAQVHQLI